MLGSDFVEIVVNLLSRYISGSRAYKAQNGVINITDTHVAGVNVNDTLVISVDDSRGIAVAINFSTVPCSEGELAEDSQAGCFRCSRSDYSFNAQKGGCIPCEENAFCTGSTVLVPLQYYWHSTPFSPKMHRCLRKKACSFEGRHDALVRFYNNSLFIEKLLADLRTKNSFNFSKLLEDGEPYQQCAKGYDGPLCGSCSYGFGHASDGSCKPCDQHLTVTRFLTLAIILLLFLSVTAKLVLEINGVRKDITFELEQQKRAIQDIFRETSSQPQTPIQHRKDESDVENPISPRQEELPSCSSAQVAIFDKTKQGGSSEQKSKGIEAVDILQETISDAHAHVQHAEEKNDDEYPNGSTSEGMPSCSVAQADVSRLEKSLSNEEMKRPFLHRSEVVKDTWLSSEQEEDRAVPSPALMDASGVLSETYNILFNHVQLNSVALFLDVDWTKTMNYLISVQASLGRIMDIQVLPFDCSLSDREHDGGIPNSLVVLWYRVCFPLACIFVYLVIIKSYTLFYGERLRSAFEVDPMPASRLIFLIVYLSCCIDVFADLLRLLNCKKLSPDDPREHMYGMFDTMEAKTVWAEDTKVTCWEGPHLVSAILGVFGLCVCFAVMGFIVAILYRGKKTQQLRRPAFLRNYGFLYLGYRTDGLALHWESVITIRRMLLAAVGVFAQSRELSNVRIGLLAIIVFTFIALHQIVQPFETPGNQDVFPVYAGSILRNIGARDLADRWVAFNQYVSLNGLEGASLFMSLSLFLTAASIVNRHGNKIETNILISVCCLLNSVFFAFMLYRLWYAWHKYLDALADEKSISFTRRQNLDEDRNTCLPKKLLMLSTLPSKQNESHSTAGRTA